MQIKKRIPALMFAVLGAVIGSGGFSLAQELRADRGAGEFRVLLVGDSWADFMWQDRVMREMFAAQGHGNTLEKGDVTAISGSTAAEWAQPDRLALITAELTANPSIDLVQLTIGGNDFLAGQPGGGWFLGMTEAQKEALFQRIETDIETVINHILAFDPQLEIVLSFYDYPNFQESLSGLLALLCQGRWQDMGEPTPLALNTVQTEFTQRMVMLSQAFPRVTLVGHLGAMQFHFGYPSMGIGPGELPLPGDLDLPSPPEAMRFFNSDCFHLNIEGHRVLAQNLWDQFYVDRFCVRLNQFRTGLGQWPQINSILDLAEQINRFCIN